MGHDELEKFYNEQLIYTEKVPIAQRTLTVHLHRIFARLQKEIVAGGIKNNYSKEDYAKLLEYWFTNTGNIDYGKRAIRRSQKLANIPNRWSEYFQLQITDYCMGALNAEKQGNHPLAWNYLLNGFENLTGYEGLRFSRRQVKLNVKEKASSSARKRHVETYEIKNQIFIWLDLNGEKYKSIDKTAEAIKKNEPISLRTAQKYVSEWRKLRPTSIA